MGQHCANLRFQGLVACRMDLDVAHRFSSSDFEALALTKSEAVPTQDFNMGAFVGDGEGIKAGDAGGVVASAQ
jgi:hypothetical protein